MDNVLLRMREIIMTVDLDTASCLAIRTQLEREFNRSLKQYKFYLNEEVSITRTPNTLYKLVNPLTATKELFIVTADSLHFFIRNFSIFQKCSLELSFAN